MKLSAEQLVLTVAYAIAIVLLLSVPKRRRREAHAVFLFQCLLTWMLGLMVVEAGLIDYPVREFVKAARTSFLYEYLAYPTVAVYFNLYYPKGKSILWQIGYYVAFSLGLTIPEVIIEKYTLLIKYEHWAWYGTFSALTATLFLSRRFYKWFFRLDPVSEKD